MVVKKKVVKKKVVKKAVPKKKKVVKKAVSKKKKLGPLHDECVKAAKENADLFEKLSKSQSPAKLYDDIRRVLLHDTMLLRRLEELL